LLATYIPTKGLEERVNQFEAHLRFVVLTAELAFPIARELLDEIDDFSWSGHLYVACRSCFHIAVSSLYRYTFPYKHAIDALNARLKPIG